jgi:hypothetical protein
MLDDAETREEWSVNVCSMLASELLHGTRLGILTAPEAQQLAARFVVLLDQALDVPAIRASVRALNPWESASQQA